MTKLYAALKRPAVLLVCCIFLCTLSGCKYTLKEKIPTGNSVPDTEKYEAQMQKAKTSPLAAYPETVTYTIGKMTGANNSNMPEGDTYEDNEYTRYIKKIINVQNVDAFEASETGGEYKEMVKMAVKTGNLPDICLVDDISDVRELAAKGLICDLTDAYENCASDTIKAIYDSYGDVILDNVRIDGKLYAIPETNIEPGPNMIWLRKDWMDKCGLRAPENLNDVKNIIKTFVTKDPGGNGDGQTVGLALDTNLTGEVGGGYEYQLDSFFAGYGAYPKHWILNDSGELTYGSVCPEVKEALAVLSDWYKEGIIDKNFLIRTTNNITELIKDGKCGAFFGPWWAPNNPLMDAVALDPSAEWVPYLIPTADDGSVTYMSQKPSGKYVVVRAGYEHPEVVLKVISVLFDHGRFEDKDVEGLKDYFKKNVDPTARPIAINVDYKDALTRCYANLSKAIVGRIEPAELEMLELSYYEACESYLNSNSPTPEEWAAYTSRITACGLLKNTKTYDKQSMFFGETETMSKCWWKLRENEQKTFLKIITGETDISSFDDFVAAWKEEGGDLITEEVRAEVNR